MGCCGEEPEDNKEGYVVKRSCRDILCLLFFTAFWVGMFIICGLAFKQGEPNRLIYGVDSYGMTCGAKNKLFDVEYDLTGNKNLYYLNPLDLLTSVDGILYAKTVCESSCPGAAEVCSRADMPCTRGNQYVCPYYRFAEDGLYDRIPGLAPTDIAYYDALLNVTGGITNGTTADFLAKVKALGGPFADIASRLEANLTGEYYQLQSQFPGNGPCYPVLVETYEFFHRCFPKFPSNLTGQLVSQLAGALSPGAMQTFSDAWQSSGQRWARYVGDISRGILVIVIAGLVGGLVLSLMWLLVLRFLGGFMVWLAILFVNLAAVAVCLYAWVKAGYIGNSAVGRDVLDALPMDINPAASEERTWFWIAVGTSIAAGITLLVTLLCITRIKVAVACIKVASQAVGTMPSLIFFPILPFIFEVGLVIYWVAVTALLYSAGDLTANCRSTAASASASITFSDLRDVSNAMAGAAADPAGAAWNASGLGSTNTYNATTTNCYANVTVDQRAYLCGMDPDCYLTYKWNNELKYAFIYHFFGLLWTNQVIVGFTCVTIAGAVGQFYWAGGDSAKLPTFPVLTSLKNTVVYHMGSIAFGAFIIAIIQLVRALLEYLDRKTKELQAANKFAEWAMCCVKCFMWCLEQVVKFINRNAYIMVAIKGKGYCQSAMAAVKLIVSNALRISVVNMVASVLIFLGKVSVAACAGVIAYAMTEAEYYNSPERYPDTYLYSPVLVIAVSVISAYCIAEIFFAVYEMSIDTIILAFCEDCDMHGGQPKYAPQLLEEVLGRAQGGDGGEKPAKG